MPAHQHVIQVVQGAMQGALVVVGVAIGIHGCRLALAGDGGDEREAAALAGLQVHVELQAAQDIAAGLGVVM